MMRKGINLDTLKSMSNPRLRRVYDDLQWMNNNKDASFMRADVSSIVTGQQISRKDMSMRDAIRINSSSDSPVSTSVGRLNDKLINVKDSVSGRVHSTTGEVNNWDNTWKIYTCVTAGDGTHAMYLGYPQNVKAKVWDNSANKYNDLTYFGGQKFRRLLVDKENGVIIQVPVND